MGRVPRETTGTQLRSTVRIWAGGGREDGAVHECQECSDQVAMVPDGEQARCPVCGSVEQVARRGPLLLVTGASGAGNTTCNL